MFICEFKLSNENAYDDKGVDNASVLSQSVEGLIQTINAYIDDNPNIVIHVPSAQAANCEDDNSTYTSYVEKEIQLLTNVEGSVQSFESDVTKIKGETIYALTPDMKGNFSAVNVNTTTFERYLELACRKCDHVKLVKPLLGSINMNELYLVTGKQVNDDISTAYSMIPVFSEKLINFLYCVYTRDMYMINLLTDIENKTSLTRTKYIKLSAADEYKLLYQEAKDLINKLT